MTLLHMCQFYVCDTQYHKRCTQISNNLNKLLVSQLFGRQLHFQCASLLRFFSFQMGSLLYNQIHFFVNIHKERVRAGWVCPSCILLLFQHAFRWGKFQSLFLLLEIIRMAYMITFKMSPWKIYSNWTLHWGRVNNVCGEFVKVMLHFFMIWS